MQSGFSWRQFQESKASYYIVVSLIIISWIIIGMKLRLPIQEEIHTRLHPSSQEKIHAFLYMPEPYFQDSMLLWLVNGDSRLPMDFAPHDLTSYHGIYLHTSAFYAYTEMLETMKIAGVHNLQLASGYRPYDYQAGLFNAKVNNLISQGHSRETATELASETVHPPGASEHQTGLALDVTITGDLTQAFADTSAGKWLAVNSHRHGFIIRYPQAKTDITHIIYEPWHLRYVGLPHSIIMYENNLTLEEYPKFIIQSGAYIVWAEENYYIVIHSKYWPGEPIPGLIGISSDRPGHEPGYIITIQRMRTSENN